MGPSNRHWYVPMNVPTVKWQGGELLAWRVWRLGRGPGGRVLLVSAFQDTVWEGPVMTADHRPFPVPVCGSGIYALKPSSRPARGQFNWAMGGETWVRGWVALSGQVVEHQFGYRAERAVIRRLRLGAAAHRAFRTPEALAAVRSDLERRYQCPVKVAGVDARIARGFASVIRPCELAPRAQTPGIPSPSLALRQRTQRTTWSKGVSPDGIKYEAVRRAFVQAERTLGTGWRLYGRGHCERVTVKPHYSRYARLGAPQSVAHFSPRGCVGWCWIYPADLVRRAAWLLKVDPAVLVSRWL